MRKISVGLGLAIVAISLGTGLKLFLGEWPSLGINAGLSFIAGAYIGVGIWEIMH